MLLGGNSSFLEKLPIPPLSKEEMRPADSTPTLAKSEEQIDAFPTISSETDRKVEMLRNVVGEEFPLEKIKHVLHGADGNIEIALNHLLNDLEKEKTTPQSNSISFQIPNHQILHQSQEVQVLTVSLLPQPKSYFTNLPKKLNVLFASAILRTQSSSLAFTPFALLV
jgi:hypothetical protein